MKNSITVFAPASVGNVGCGFDVMGLCIDTPGDEVKVSFNNTNKLLIKKISGDGGKLSYDANQNTVSVAIAALLKKIKSKQGFDIELKKKMPLGSGLGSSAASAVAGAFAANELLGKPIKKRMDLVPFAMEGERVACGTAHADNVAPCMLGGISLIRNNSPLELISLPVPKNLYVVVVHPHVEVLTKDARAVMRKEIPMPDAIKQWGNTAALVAGLYESDYTLIGKAIEDVIAEPYRAKLIPEFYKVKQAAIDNGALGCTISGSGPSLFALCKGNNGCKKIATAMQKAFAAKNIKSDAFISKVNSEGVKVIS